MTDPQKRQLMLVLKEYSGQFHHGDCLGADEQANDMAVNSVRPIATNTPRYHIVIHPPSDDKIRAYCNPEGCEIRLEKPYITRNHEMIDETDRLIATPKTVQEELMGSGTWATIRYARKLKRPVMVIFPDGSFLSTGQWA